jgi:hypothetical protein
VAVEQVGSNLGLNGPDRVNLTKRNIKSQIGFDDSCRIGSSFGSNTVRFLRVSGHFRFLLAHVISSFRSFGFESGWVLGHLILGSLRFWIFWGRAWRGQFFCHDLFQVRSGSILSHQILKLFSKIYFSQC